MNKKHIVIGAVTLAILLAGFFILSHKKENPNLEQSVMADTVDISRQYLELRILTDNTLTKASEYTDYQSWNKQMSSLLSMWEKLDKQALELEKTAAEYSEAKVSFNLLNTAQAVTTQEINDVFDKAPAGKKIKTLANYLGVDAKRAYKILQQTQNEVEADAWNEAGDTFQKLETSAVVIKDGCKVAGFVGGVIISGGTSAIAAGSTLSQVAVVVTGADLVLEVSEDAANIGLGNNNKVAAIIGDARKFTEPAAAILTIADLPKNLATNFEKFNAFMFGLDNFRSSAQEGKVIGIALPVYEGKEMKVNIDGQIMDRSELEDWLQSQGYDDYSGYLDGLFKTNDPQANSESVEEAEENNEETKTEAENPSQEETGQAETADTSAKIVPKTVYGKDGKVNISLESPLDKVFWRGQARMWKLNIQGFDQEAPGLSYACDWRFYVGDKLVSEQLDNRACHFTTTEASQVGTLVMKVDFKIKQGRSVFDDNGEYVDYVQDTLETIPLSEEFTVVAPVDTYRHP